MNSTSGCCTCIIGHNHIHYVWQIDWYVLEYSCEQNSCYTCFYFIYLFLIKHWWFYIVNLTIVKNITVGDYGNSIKKNSQFCSKLFIELCHDENRYYWATQFQCSVAKFCQRLSSFIYKLNTNNGLYLFMRFCIETIH